MYEIWGQSCFLMFSNLLFHCWNFAFKNNILKLEPFYPTSPFNCSGVLSSSHSLQMFFPPIRRHALNPAQRIRNNVNHPTYLYQKFNFMAISRWLHRSNGEMGGWGDREKQQTESSRRRIPGRKPQTKRTVIEHHFFKDKTAIFRKTGIHMRRLDYPVSSKEKYLDNGVNY